MRLRSSPFLSGRHVAHGTGTKSLMPRRKQFEKRTYLNLPISAEMLAQIDAARGDVARVVFIRRALEEALAKPEETKQPRRKK